MFSFFSGWYCLRNGYWKNVLCSGNPMFSFFFLNVSCPSPPNIRESHGVTIQILVKRARCFHILASVCVLLRYLGCYTFLRPSDLNNTNKAPTPHIRSIKKKEYIELQFLCIHSHTHTDPKLHLPFLSFFNNIWRWPSSKMSLDSVDQIKNNYETQWVLFIYFWDTEPIY